MMPSPMSEIFGSIKTIFVCLYNIIMVLFRGWSLKKALNFSNLFKLVFIYSVSIFWVIVIDFDTSPGFWKKAITGSFSDKRISFYAVTNRIGEGVLYERVLKVSKEQGYDYSASRMPESLTHFWITKHFYYAGASILNYILKPKFNLALTHHVNVVPYGYNITYLNMPRDSLYKPTGEFQRSWTHLNEYDAYGDLYTYVHGSNDMLSEIAKGRKIVPLYLAQYDTKYVELPMKKALITGSLWGCNRGSLRAKRAIKKLAENDLLVAIGLSEYFSFLGSHYLGRLEDFGKVVSAIDEVQKQYGIALIFHSQEHMLDGIPTSRVSEVASASALIITDLNEFVKKFFGDNALYFNAFGTDEEMFQQIKQHVKWAQDNPAEALKKTKEVHRIFKEKLTIEYELKKLLETPLGN